MSPDGLQASSEKMRAADVGDAAIDTFAHYYEQLREGASGMLPERDIEPVEDLPTLDELPDAFRQAVWLRDVEEFTYAEIAEMLNVPIGTVMSRLHRGRKALQKRLFDFASQRGLVPDGMEDPNPSPDAPAPALAE